MLPVVVTSSKEQQAAASSENYTLSKDIYSTNNGDEQRAATFATGNRNVGEHGGTLDNQQVRETRNIDREGRLTLLILSLFSAITVKHGDN